MRIDICCGKPTCTSCGAAKKFLASWGIRPALKKDRASHYLVYDLPDDWPPARKRQFIESLNMAACRVPTGIHCPFCGLVANLHVNRCDCGTMGLGCLACLREAGGRCWSCHGGMAHLAFLKDYREAHRLRFDALAAAAQACVAAAAQAGTTQLAQSQRDRDRLLGCLTAAWNLCEMETVWQQLGVDSTAAFGYSETEEALRKAAQGAFAALQPPTQLERFNRAAEVLLQAAVALVG